MALKEFLKKFLIVFQNNEVKKSEINSIKKFSLVVYPAILLLTFVIYSYSYKTITDQKVKNEKNLEKFFVSEEFSNVKNTFFGNLIMILLGKYLENLKCRRLKYKKL